MMLIALLLVLSSAHGLDVIPLPSSYTSANTTLIIASGFVLRTASKSALLAAGMERYNSLIMYKGTPNASSGLSTLFVNVVSSDEKLDLGVDESYTLTINSTMAVLTAQTVFGALHGLETISQLTMYNKQNSQYEIRNGPISIDDQPRFPHRGLLLDCSRHFQPMDNVLKIIDAMTYAKLNVLHWHAVDAIAFAMESKAFPKLSQQGAYAPEATYSSQDIDNVVAYAYERGIRVIAEFDIPGHATSWGYGYPITTNCPKLLHNVNNGALSPASNQTLPLLQGLLAEMATTHFHDSHFHLGGDEVVTDCWNEDPEVVAWQHSKGLDNKGTYEYFVNFGESVINGLHKTPVHWEEVFTNGLKIASNAVINVWKNADVLQQVIAGGHYAIQSAGWYACYVELTWQQMYANEPVPATASTKEAALVLGGEVSMWGEWVNPSNIQARLWPRAAAVAERLWSPKETTDETDFEARGMDFTCLLLRRGIPTGMFGPGYCHQN